MRLAEALARMRLSAVVTSEDVHEGLRLMKVCPPTPRACATGLGSVPGAVVDGVPPHGSPLHESAIEGPICSPLHKGFSLLLTYVIDNVSPTSSKDLSICKEMRTLEPESWPTCDHGVIWCGSIPSMWWAGG